MRPKDEALWPSADVMSNLPYQIIKHSLCYSSQVCESLGLSESRGQEPNRVTVGAALVTPKEVSIGKRILSIEQGRCQGIHITVYTEM